MYVLETGQTVAGENVCLPTEANQTVERDDRHLTAVDERKPDNGTNSLTCTEANHYLTLIKGSKLYYCLIQYDLVQIDDDNLDLFTVQN